jgi:hypothetical protein
MDQPAPFMELVFLSAPSWARVSVVLELVRGLVAVTGAKTIWLHYVSRGLPDLEIELMAHSSED